MSTKISCPRCNHPVDSQIRYCENCGVDLALAAVLAEQSLSLLENLPSDVPITPEILVPRLGDYLIEKGVISQDELQKALEYQKERSKNGKPCLIGQAFVELGFIDRSTLDEVITEQILQLQHALRQANQYLEKRVQERTADLQHALSKLSELNQLKSNFISNISHELRTPLTHIKGYLDLLADGSLGPLTTQQYDALKALQRAEARLERLIEDLIQFSLAARSELSLRFEVFNPMQIVQSALDRVSQKAKENQIALVVTAPNHLPRVRADPEKIGWVLMQLLDNAIKFTPQGGRVEVHIETDGRLVSIHVIDTGIGIPSERIPEIFEPFHQLDGSPKRRYSGTGLGLTLVKRILDAHGSTIHVESKVGEGSHFTFSIPIATL